MSINASDFSSLVVVPALQLLAPAGIPYSKVAHDLLMGTAAQESLMGTYLQQESGPGVGVFMATMSEVGGILGRCAVPIYTAILKVGNPLDAGRLLLISRSRRWWRDVGIGLFPRRCRRIRSQGSGHITKPITTLLLALLSKVNGTQTGNLQGSIFQHNKGRVIIKGIGVLLEKV